MKKISKKQAAKFLKLLYLSKYPYFFHVKFIKRTTGEIRDITCRLDVSKFLKGGPDAYNPLQKNLIWVCEVPLMKDGKHTPYRSINLDAILEIKIAKNHFVVEQEVTA